MNETAADYKLVRAVDVAPQPWVNGGGETRTLLASPHGNDWNFRISLARIEKDGPFSTFVGIERWFAVVEGAGVQLQFSTGEVAVCRCDAPIRFDGGDAPGCRLINGPTQDINLMTRRGVGAIRLAVSNKIWQEQFDERGYFATSSGCLYFNAVDGGGLPLKHRSLRLEAFYLLWNIGAADCWFEPDECGNAGLWLGHSR